MSAWVFCLIALSTSVAVRDDLKYKRDFLGDKAKKPRKTGPKTDIIAYFIDKFFRESNCEMNCCEYYSTDKANCNEQRCRTECKKQLAITWEWDISKYQSNLHLNDGCSDMFFSTEEARPPVEGWWNMVKHTYSNYRSAEDYCEANLGALGKYYVDLCRCVYDIRRSIQENNNDIWVKIDDVTLNLVGGNALAIEKIKLNRLSLHIYDLFLRSRRAAACGRAQLLANSWRRGMGQFPRKCKLRGPCGVTVRLLWGNCGVRVHFAAA